MLSEAEQYKAEDDAQRERVAARNQLEGYAFSMSSALQDCADKLSPENKAAAEDKVKETLGWLDGNSLATKEEYTYQLEELQRVCSPVMAHLHGGGKGGSSDSTTSGQARSGPTVEEVD